MNIWILNHHALTPEMSGGTRHYDAAKELVKRGHKVTIIASSFHYSKLQEMKEYKSEDYLIEDIESIKFIWFKTPPYSNNGVKRVVNMLSYTKKALFLLPRLDLEKPDIIIGSSVHLFAVFAAQRLSKRYKTPFIMEVRDLWPQTLIDMGVSKYHPFVVVLAQLEKYLYKRADKIITLLPDAYKYIEKFVDRGKIEWISNGTTLCDTQTSEQKMALRSGKFNVLYTGTLGLANNLELLVKSADLLRDDSSIYFTIIGDGPLKGDLQNMADELKLNNIQFIPSVPKKDIFMFLSSADLLYVGLKDLPLYRYGMSMNKVFDYMSAKKPILFVSTLKDSVIERSNAGAVLNSSSPTDIAECIRHFEHTPKIELERFGENGYNYLLKNFTVAILTDKLERVLIEAKRE